MCDDVGNKRLPVRWFSAFLLEVLTFGFILSSCASVPPNVQPQVNSLIVANKTDRAIQLLEENRKAYGPNNELLYLLDEALVLHVAKRYADSIPVFEDAKSKFDELYTQSLSKGLSAWVINDYRSPYHGEDFEHVLVNIFQALNFAALNDFNEALVEARDVDDKLSLINRQYPPDQKNVYKEDAFARLLMGILYEVNQTQPDDNDAFISYQKSYQTYTQDYTVNYGTEIPSILKENLLASAQFMGPETSGEYRQKLNDVPFMSLEEKRKKGQVYLIQYNGLAPIKTQFSLPVPLPGGFITRLAFPKYNERLYEIENSFLSAKSDTGKGFETKTELVENISRIAVQNLENRKVRLFAKAVARPAAKYVLEKTAEAGIRSRSGDNTALAFRIVSSLFNVYSEQADLRSWQTLPAELRLARFILEPGA